MLPDLVAQVPKKHDFVVLTFYNHYDVIEIQVVTFSACIGDLNEVSVIKRKFWPSFMESCYVKASSNTLISREMTWPFVVLLKNNLLKEKLENQSYFICRPMMLVIYSDSLRWARRLSSDTRIRMYFLSVAGYFSTVGGAFATFKHWRKSLKYAIKLRAVGSYLGNQSILFQCDLYIGYAYLWKFLSTIDSQRNSLDLENAEKIFHRQLQVAKTVVEENQCMAALEKLAEAL